MYTLSLFQRGAELKQHYVTAIRPPCMSRPDLCQCVNALWHKSWNASRRCKSSSEDLMETRWGRDKAAVWSLIHTPSDTVTDGWVTLPVCSPFVKCVISLPDRVLPAVQCNLIVESLRWKGKVSFFSFLFAIFTLPCWIFNWKVIHVTSLVTLLLSVIL